MLEHLHASGRRCFQLFLGSRGHFLADGVFQIGLEALIGIQLRAVARKVERFDLAFPAKGPSWLLSHNPSRDSHHAPVDSTYDSINGTPVSSDNKPAFQMDKADHAQAVSYDNKPGAAAYRQTHDADFDCVFVAEYADTLLVRPGYLTRGHVPATRDTRDALAPVIDKRFAEWRSRSA